MASSSKFQIPSEFADQLTYNPTKDKRSDADILAALSKHQPVNSEKNIWAYWHSGMNSIPSWCQRNVTAWQRICGPEWTIRVLDSVPGSPNHALEFVTPDLLPAAFVQNAMDGEYFGPHSADLLRGALLWQHGGAFLDVGIVLLRSLDRICWAQLEDEKSPFNVGIPWMYGIMTANHFVAARKQDPFIKRWHDLFVYCWRDKTNSNGLRAEPLLAFAQTLSFDESRASKYYWDFKVDAATVLEYITQVVCWMRICMLEDTDDSFSGVDYWKNNVLIWDVLPEAWGGEEHIGFVGSGQKMFDLFSVRLDADPESEEYKAVYSLTWRLLTKSSMQKVTHGKHLTDSVHLGVLWDEHEGRDCKEGTFAELLRYGAENFEQAREKIEFKDTPAPGTTLKKGLLEP